MRLTVFGFLFLIITTFSFAQNKYRTRASGDWSNPSIWQVENPINVWSIATNSPDFNDDRIQIRSGHTVTISSNIIIDQTVVVNGGRLNINDGVTVTLNDGVGNDFSMGATAETHFIGEGHIAGLGNAILNGNLYLYSVNPTGAITSGTAATGNIRIANASRSYYSTTTIHFVGNASQVWGSAHPAAPSTRINNPFGVQVIGSTETNGILTVQQGTLSIGSENFRITSAVNVTGGSLEFSNSTLGSRTFNLLDLSITGGSVVMSSSNGSNSARLFISNVLNLQGGDISLQSGTGNLILEVNGDISGTGKILGTGSRNYIYLNGTGDLSNTFPVAQNATIRTLRINRPGLQLTIPYSFDLSWLSLFNGEITLNTDFTIQRDLNLALGTSLDFSGISLTLNGPVGNSFTGGVLTSDALSNLNIQGTTGSTAALTFSEESQLQNLTINRPGGATLNSNLTITGVLSLNRSFLTLSGTLNMANGSTIIRDAGCSFTGSAPTGGPYSVSYTGTSLTTGIEAQGSLNNLTSSLSGTLTVNTPLNLAGDLTINSGTFTSGTHAISANDFFSDGLFNAPSSTLSLSGNLTNNGPFNANNGEVILNGGATQNISGTSLIQFNDLTLATGADVSIESNQNLRGVLTLNDNATLDADGSSESAIFTVLSVGDAAGSDGSIAALGTGASVIGDISVQRYWGVEDDDFRYISSPVANGTLQQLIDANVLITGYPGSPFPCGGDCDNDNANLSHYDETLLGTFQNGWTDFPGPAGDASATFVPGRGYGLYMWNGTQPTLWTSRGTLNQGTMVFDISHTPSSPAEPSADGWNLIGNPYASSIRWEDNAELPGGWTFGGNVSPTVWIYDEVAEVWRSYNRNSNAGNFDGVIATGQAFWVQVTSADANATLEVHEAAKTGNSGAYYRTTTVNPMFIISLSQGDFEDQVFAILQDEANTKKFSLGKERMSLAFLGDEGDRFAYYSLNESSDNMPLSIRVREAGDYTLQLSTKGVDGYFIVDKLLNTTIPASESYSFTVLAGNQTINDRFMVTRTPGALPQIREDVLIEAYPNPVVSQLTIRVGGEVERIDIMNSVGQTFASIDSELVTFVDGVSTAEVSLDDLQQGVYIVRVVKSDRSVYIRKILKR